MTNTVVRTVGYTGSTEEIVWTQGNNVPVTAYLWGGGGGGGGNDSAPGGYGSGGSYASVSFTVSNGDSIKLAVGGQGGAGLSGTRSQGGGSAGGSYTIQPVFNTRSATSSPPVYPQTNGNYCTFLNTYGVWENPSSAATFDRSWTVNFPNTDEYTFTMSADNAAELLIDGVAVFYANNYTTTYESLISVTAGDHVIRIRGQNTGGPGAVGLTIDGGTSYSGGRGGNAGGSGSSGGGGGGGGATVLLLNSTVLAVAGGGAGGGGGGNNGVQAQSAPGTRGQAATSITAGQNGINKSGDGGGAGGGGGGYGGGNGGEAPGGDVGGRAGSYGGSYSLNGSTAWSSSRVPAGRDEPYWSYSRGQGGANKQNGTTGSATLVFTLTGTYVHSGGSFAPVSKTYVHDSDSWKLVKAMYVKKDGIWALVLGSFAPIFNTYPSLFGVNSRKATGDSGGGGGGGGKIICTKLYQLGLMTKEIYEADQAFGAQLVKTNPDIYNGYRAWAEIVVDWMDGKSGDFMKSWAITWAHDIATPWSEHMAYKMGALEKDNVTGRIIAGMGLPICKLSGVWQRVFGASKKPAGFVKGAMLIPVFAAFKAVVALSKLLK